jgi:uncharacterized protein (DUF1697 family)
MSTWIALLRGINVVGNNVLPMKDLVRLFEREGCEGARSYIASGNVVFRSPKRVANTLPTRIAAAISRSRGFTPSVLVLSASELADSIAENPFPAAVENPKSLHLFFLAQTPTSPDLEALSRLATGREAFALKGRIFYLHTPDGFADSKIGSRAERLIGVDATARNWRTVTALNAMAQDLR